METCSPASQSVAGRGQVTLKTDFKMDGNQAWARTWMEENGFNPRAMLFGPGEGARAGRKQGRAGEPRWPQPAHQVTKEDVVQSRNQVLWTCYLLVLRVRGNAGPKAGPVLVLMPIPQPQKESSLCLPRGNRTLPP